ncbi:MAG: Spore germination protein B3 [Candidatus Dichloromethanomonas elyunquensis]|nr:MAG: Spore germination protein B3 [Candidatus Dichloromethanomonas elyunquensis]
MNWGKNKLLLLGVLLLLPALGGCWDSSELNTVAITSVIGIEQIRDSVHLALEIYNPAGEGELQGTQKANKAKYVQSTGQSFFDAIRNVNILFDKKIFLAHTKELIFNEETAKNGFVGLLDLWARQHATWPDAYLLVSRGVRPSEVIGVTNGLEETSANYIEDLIANSKDTGKTVRTTAFDFLKEFYNGGYPVVGVITKKEKAKDAQENSTEDELETEGAAVFSGQNMIGFLNGPETRGLNFATGKIRSAIIVSPSVEGQGVNSLEILNAGRKIDVHMEGEKVLFDLKIDISAMLGGETGRPDTSGNPSVMKAIAEQNSETVRREVEQVITKVQEDWRTDIFGFGQALHQKYPDQWKTMKNQWNQIFPDAEITVTVKTDLKWQGLLDTPLERRSES